MQILAMILVMAQLSFAGSIRTLTFNIDGIDEISTTSTHSKLQFRGIDGDLQALDAQPGRPQIPVIRWIEDGFESIDIEWSEEILSADPFTRPVYPQQWSAAKNTARVSWFNEVERSSEFLPRDIYEVTELGRVKGMRRVMVSLYPLRLRASDQMWTLRQHFRVAVQKQVPSVSKMLALVVPSQWKDAVASFAEHKIKMGYEVKIVEASEDADAIRRALMELHAEFPLHAVMLLGDVDVIPSFPSRLLGMAFYNFDSQLLGSDYPFRELDAPMEDLGFAPDVLLGRFAARSSHELKMMLERSMRFEAGTFASDSAWRKRGSLLATNDPTFARQTEAAMDGMAGLLSSRWGSRALFPELFPQAIDRYYAGRYAADREAVLHGISEGRGLIIYSGHGLPHQWNAPRVTSRDLEELPRSEATPIVISLACQTAQLEQPLSLARSWQQHSSVIFVGSRADTYWDEDDLLQKKWFQEWNESPELSFAAQLDRGLSEVYRMYGGQMRSEYYQHAYQFLGDPTLLGR